MYCGKFQVLVPSVARARTKKKTKKEKKQTEERKKVQKQSASFNNPLMVLGVQ